VVARSRLWWTLGDSLALALVELGQPPLLWSMDKISTECRELGLRPRHFEVHFINDLKTNHLQSS
jgi:hypothetical protein